MRTNQIKQQCDELKIIDWFGLVVNNWNKNKKNTVVMSILKFTGD